MSEESNKVEAASTRRAVLRFGAAAVPAAMTLRASPASAASSVLTCTVPFGQTIKEFRVSGVDKWITASGTLVNKPSSYNSTSGPFPPLQAGAGYTGEELKPVKTGGASAMPTGKMMSNGQTTNSKAAAAHYQYLYNNSGNSSVTGYTCLVSVINTA